MEDDLEFFLKLSQSLNYRCIVNKFMSFLAWLWSSWVGAKSIEYETQNIFKWICSFIECECVGEKGKHYFYNHRPTGVNAKAHERKEGKKVHSFRSFVLVNV